MLEALDQKQDAVWQNLVTDMTRCLESSETTASTLAMSSSRGSLSSTWLDSDTLSAALLFSNDVLLGGSIIATCRRAQHNEINIKFKVSANFMKAVYTYYILSATAIWELQLILCQNHIHQQKQNRYYINILPYMFKKQTLQHARISYNCSYRQWFVQINGTGIKFAGTWWQAPQ